MSLHCSASSSSFISSSISERKENDARLFLGSERRLSTAAAIGEGQRRIRWWSTRCSGSEPKRDDVETLTSPRRTLLTGMGLLVGAAGISASNKNNDWAHLLGGAALAEEAAVDRSQFTDMPALRGKDYGKSRMKYPDYVETETGLQYKDLRDGTGDIPNTGDLVVIDWDGFTIGYYGRIFEARNKAKGGSFEGSEKDFFRFRLGVGQVIPAFEEAVASMRVGGIRRIIVPPELGYPDNDFNKKGPRPLTFSGQRALDFVLKNQGLIDKTLLFDIELLKIIPS